MTNLLDILKETELRVRFTDVFRTVGSREALPSDVPSAAAFAVPTRSGHQRRIEADVQRRRG